MNHDTKIKLCLVSSSSFIPSRWQTVLYLREHYNIGLNVAAPPKAKIPSVYDSSGYLTLTSAGLQECPPFVTLIPLNDIEKPEEGFQAKPLKKFLHRHQFDMIWIHSEPLWQVSRDICKWYFFSRRPKIYQAAAENLHSLGRGVNRLKSRILLKRMNALLSVSQSTAHSVEIDLGVDTRKNFVTYLPNIPLPKKEMSRESSDGFRIGFAGRMVAEKGILVLLDALDLLPENIQLFTAGNGEEAIIRRLQNHPQVYHMGLLHNLTPLFSQIDALVVPSLTMSTWKEQFGRVIAEAFSVGIPVIGSDSGSIPDVVGNGGLIYPEHSSKALSEQIIILSSNQVLYQELATNATLRFSKHFSVAAHAQRLATIFNLDRKQSSVLVKGHN